MAKRRPTIESFWGKYETLRRNKKDFVLIETKSGAKIITPEETISVSAWDFNGKLSGLVRSVKKDATGKDGLFVAPPDPEDFLEISPDIPEQGIVIQVDLKAAYWNAAKDTFLSVQTYEKGIPKQNDPKDLQEQTKNNRLIALGNLAVKIKETRYEKGIPFEPNIYQPETAPLFFTCQKITSITMQNLMKLGGFGFWVDCVFCPNSERIEEYLNDYGIEYTKKSEKYLFSIQENKLQIGKKVYQFPKFLNKHEF